MCVCAPRRTESARAAQSGRTAEEKSPAADRAAECRRPEGTEQRRSAPGRSGGADGAAAVVKSETELLQQAHTSSLLRSL
ncbi:hypothetical protein FQA47_005321 [Oryzias melastigma]|uniref:Uncharacterized protein n=1 Tax=Oryzias melastigma TaxID=30732 RepID=A0A834CT89_ORYME|nr:hypothetical protein FQA47_005321 [Oryzias melastigma]